MPTINVSKYFIRNKNISGLASAFAYKIKKNNKCKEENIFIDFFLNEKNPNFLNERLSPYGFVEACTADKHQTRTVKLDVVQLSIHTEEICQKELFFF